jgi:hypothetical protein
MPKRHTNAVFLGDLRGRTAGKITHLERIAAEVAASLAAARASLEAVDRGIALFDPRIDPTTLPRILSNKKVARGAEGGLTVDLKTVLEKAGTEGLSTREIGWALHMRNGLAFETPQELTRFLQNTVKRRLLQMADMDIVESFDDPTEVDEISGRRSLKRWRLKKAGTSIESLVADAKACGAEVMVVDAECQLPAGTNPPD